MTDELRKERASARLRSTTEQMANRCTVDAQLWNDHSNAALEADDEIRRLRAELKERDEAETDWRVYVKNRRVKMEIGVQGFTLENLHEGAEGEDESLHWMAGQLRFALSRLAAPAPRWAVPEGWKLVPVEPTDPMRDAGWDAMEEWRDPTDPAALLDAYHAMLSAAPTPPAEGEDDLTAAYLAGFHRGKDASGDGREAWRPSERQISDAIFTYEQHLDLHGPNSHRNAMRAALLATQAEKVGDSGVWRPIKSAPRDGRSVLLHNYDSAGNHAYVQWESGCGFEPDDIGATHWSEVHPPVPAQPVYVVRKGRRMGLNTAEAALAAQAEKGGDGDA